MAGRFRHDRGRRNSKSDAGVALNRPHIALNMTTLNQGGVLQRAVSFLQHLESDFADFQWHLLLSPRMQHEVNNDATVAAYPQQVFSVSPARNLKARRAITDAISRGNPDLVFTFGGPSYLNLSRPELMGFTDGWVTHAGAEALASVPSRSARLKLRLSAQYKLGWIRQADYLIAQTETARRGLAERLSVAAESIYLIPNVVADWYREMRLSPRPLSLDQPIRLLYLAAAYDHKRHDFLPAICAVLQQSGLGHVRITVTIPPESKIWKRTQNRARRLGVAEMIENIGPVPVTEGPRLYAEHQICLVPTVLETFTATYVEAMATQTPIVTCDLDFAREACEDAALYFPAIDPVAAAECIRRLVDSRQLVQNLCHAGQQKIKNSPNVADQMRIYRNVLRDVISRLASRRPRVE